jgi:hypothetical protein
MDFSLIFLSQTGNILPNDGDICSKKRFFAQYFDILQGQDERGSRFSKITVSLDFHCKTFQERYRLYLPMQCCRSIL